MLINSITENNSNNLNTPSIVQTSDENSTSSKNRNFGILISSPKPDYSDDVVASGKYLSNSSNDMVTPYLLLACISFIILL